MKKLTLGVVAHVDAGKTTLSENILYKTGAIRTMGRVDHQDTFLDTDEMEKERGITIYSKMARFTYKDTNIILLDTPGHVDFSAEMERTLWTLDAAILVISGPDGVQGHTRTLWKLLVQYQVPVMIFINKMDICHRTREEILEQLKKELDGNCVDFTDVSIDEHGQVVANESVMEEIATCDERILDAYMACGKIEKKQVQGALLSRLVFPCVYGCALKGDGVEELLDIVDSFSKAPEYDRKFGAKVFKIERDAQKNRLTHMKITGGSLKVKESIAKDDWCDKVNQIRLYSGDRYTSVDMVEAGEICTIMGLEHTYAGEGLGKQEEERMPILEPVLSYQVIPPAEMSPFVLLQKMRLLEEEEPLLCVEWKEPLEEIHVHLMGPVQTEILQKEIKERFNVLVTFSEGSIVYKETICDVVEGVGHFEPLRHYAEVHLKLEPLPLGSGMQYGISCKEDDLDKNWQRLIYTHLEEKEHIGVLTGSAITDMKITLVAGKAHKKHTEGGDFRQATYRAIRQGLKKANSQLLEPYYKVTLRVPTANVGRAMSDMQKMNGTFESPVVEEDMSILVGKAPVVKLTNYATQVLSYTGGRGSISLELMGYYPCHNEEEVVEQIQYDSEADVENPTGSVFCAHGAGFVVPWFEVEEYMHLPFALQEKNEDEKEKILTAKNIRYAPKEQGYDGYGGLGSDLEEIFEKTYGPVKRRLPSQEIVRRDYDAAKMAREEYERTHPNNKKPKKKKKYFLVDGYNVIFAWEELALLAKTNLDSARGKLMDDMCNYQGFIGSELILVFDAYKVKGNTETVTNYHNIHVVYTKEAETADAYIERVTHEIGKEHDVTVATSDGLEQMIVIGEGARRMSSRELKEDLLRVTAEGLEDYRRNHCQE